MPDTKLTWAGLREHLRRSAAIYLAVLAACMVLTNLLWTTTAPRVPDEKRVLIYLADGYTNASTLNDLAQTVLERARRDDPTLEQVQFMDLMYTGQESDYTGSILLATRLSLGEADLFLASAPTMEALVADGACLPLDEMYKDGFMRESGLEPWYAEVTDEETGETTTFLAGFRLDGLEALDELGAIQSEGHYLAVISNGTNIETSARAAEILAEALREASE